MSVGAVASTTITKDPPLPLAPEGLDTATPSRSRSREEGDGSYSQGKVPYAHWEAWRRLP